MLIYPNTRVACFIEKNYRIFKENFEFENYFRVLEDKDIYTLCKFRTTNHKLPIPGRWNNIDRVNRICTKCDNITIGDEYHYIMECIYNKDMGVRQPREQNIYLYFV
jgi:hypothetical protein